MPLLRGRPFSPQDGPNAPLVPTTSGNTGGLHLNPLATYSTDIAPDIVAKAAYDPDGWGHDEDPLADGWDDVVRHPGAPLTDPLLVMDRDTTSTRQATTA